VNIKRSKEINDQKMLTLRRLNDTNLILKADNRTDWNAKMKALNVKWDDGINGWIIPITRQKEFERLVASEERKVELRLLIATLEKKSSSDRQRHLHREFSGSDNDTDDEDEDEEEDEDEDEEGVKSDHEEPSLEREDPETYTSLAKRVAMI
jgi:hypothetical protein